MPIQSLFIININKGWLLDDVLTYQEHGDDYRFSLQALVHEKDLA